MILCRFLTCTCEDVYLHELRKIINVHEERLPVHLSCVDMSYINFDHLDLLYLPQYVQIMKVR